MATYKVSKILTDISSATGDAISELQELKDELSNWAEGMESGNLANSEKCSQVREAADAFENADEIDVPSVIEGETVTVAIMVPTRKRYNPSRNIRASNAVSKLQAAMDEAQNLLDNAEDDGEAYSDEERSEIESYISDVESLIGYVDGVEIPGMY